MARKQPTNRKKPNGARRRGELLNQRRLRVYQAWCRGVPNYEIAAAERVNPGQITRDVAVMLTEVHGRRVDVAEEATNQLLAEIEWQLQELRAAWERSKKPKDRKRAKRTEGVGRDGKGERRDAETVTEGRDGNPKFQAEITKLQEFKAKLENLLKERHEHTGPNGGPIQHTVLTDEQRATALARLYAAVGRSHRSEPAPGETGQPGGEVPGGPEPDSI